jgi:hypothetical protein
MTHHTGGGVYYQGPQENMDGSYRFADGPNQGMGYRPARGDFGPQETGPHNVLPICDICQEIMGNTGALSNHRRMCVRMNAFR